MEKISPETFTRIARLARLSFSAEEKETMRADIAKMVSFADEVSSLSTDSVPPFLPEGSAQNSFRADAEEPSLTRREALQNAPSCDNACFLVPRTVEEGEK